MIAKYNMKQSKFLKYKKEKKKKVTADEIGVIRFLTQTAFYANDKQCNLVIKPIKLIVMSG